jgi:glycosyltransferase 2 family protein
MIRSALRHPLLSSAAAAAASVAAILTIGSIAHLRTVVHAIGHLHPGWLGVAVGAEILSLPSYALAYRTIVRRYSHQYLTARVTLHMVLAGFGLFAVLGGFSVDRLGLQRLGADPEGARHSVLALALVEIVTLASAGFAASIALLAAGSPVPGSMLWPWAIGVPGASLVAVGLLTYARRHRQTWSPRLQKLADHGWLLIGMLRELTRLPQAWCGIGLYFIADIASLYAAVRAVGLRLGVGAVLIAYASGYLFTRRTLPLASAAFVEVLLTLSLFWVGAPLASALAAVIVYRTLGLPLYVGGGMIARSLLWPLMRGSPASALSGKVCSETSQSPPTRPKA